MARICAAASALNPPLAAIRAALSATSRSQLRRIGAPLRLRLKQLGIEHARFGTEDKVPAALKAKVAAREKAMREGKFKVRIGLLLLV